MDLDLGAGAHFIRRGGSSYRLDEQRAARSGARRLRMQDPSPDRLAPARFGVTITADHDRGDTGLARRVLRLVTLVMLFVLAVMTGMLLPPSWMIGRP